MKQSFLYVLIGVLAATLTFGAVMLNVQLDREQSQPAFQDITVELGATAVNASDFLIDPNRPGQARFVSDVRYLDLGQVGTTPVTLRLGELTQTVQLTVRDTTAPAVEFKSDVVADLSYTPTAEDFISSVTDCSSTTVAFTVAPQTPDTYSDQQVEITVTDRYGNATSGTSTLHFNWMRTQVVAELGTPVTKADILLDAQRDDALIQQEALDEINAGGVGTYTLTVQSGESTQTCAITIQDTTPPALLLQPVSIYPSYTCKAEDFIVSATDLSGDVNVELLSELPFGTIGDHLISFKATDIHGNTVTKEAMLRIHTDITPPTIYGMYTIELTANAQAPDYAQHVFAVDNSDGYVDVTYDTSDVDLTRAGIYYVVYTAADSTGNLGIRNRKVVIRPDYANTEKLISEIAMNIEDTSPEGLRDFVRNNITYYSTWGGSDPVAFGFTNWYGNCYVHALCLQALFDYYGYENELIWVTSKTHYWNLVKIDDVWYHIDSTPGTVHTRYSLMDNEKRLKTLGGRRWDTSLWPQMNEQNQE